MACERFQFSKKTHEDNASFYGVGIVRKSDANPKRIPATYKSIKTILLRFGRLRERPENCVTLHDAEARRQKCRILWKHPLTAVPLTLAPGVLTKEQSWQNMTRAF